MVLLQLSQYFRLRSQHLDHDRWLTDNINIKWRIVSVIVLTENKWIFFPVRRFSKVDLMEWMVKYKQPLVKRVYVCSSIIVPSHQTAMVPWKNKFKGYIACMKEYETLELKTKTNLFFDEISFFDHKTEWVLCHHLKSYQVNLFFYSFVAEINQLSFLRCCLL